MTTSEFDAAAAHRHFATDCFNRVWELLEKPDRSADEDRMMVAMSHGGFSFLDAIGFRYYLPPAMIRCLQSGYDEGIQFHLGEPDAEFQQYKCEQLSLLDHDQRRCIARFLLYMARRSDEPYLTGNAKDEWLKTLNAGWWQHLEADSPLPIE